MQLIVTIVDDRDVDKVVSALTKERIGVTCVSSTGGLFVPGNSTLLIGVDEQLVPVVTQVITEMAAPRQTFVPFDFPPSSGIAGGFAEVPVGGYMSFVMNIDSFEQV